MKQLASAALLAFAIVGTLISSEVSAEDTPVLPRSFHRPILVWESPTCMAAIQIRPASVRLSFSLRYMSWTVRGIRMSGESTMTSTTVDWQRS